MNTAGRQNDSDVRTVYEQRREEFDAQRTAIARRSTHVSHARTMAFVLLIAAGLLLERTPGLLTIVLTATLLVAFVALIRYHRRLHAREQWFAELADVNRSGVLRLDRDWEQLPPRHASIDVPVESYAGDLDLFGHAAVAQLLGPGSSAAGAAVLDGWLLTPADPATAAERQRAVIELASQLDLRERIALHGRRSRAVRPTDIDRFLAWAESEPWLLQRGALRALATLIPLTTLVLLALHLTGVLGPLWLVTATAAALLSIGFMRRMHATFDAAFGREGMFEHFPELIGAIAAGEYTAPLLRAVRVRVTPEGEPAQHRIARLRSIMHLADLRFSSMQFIVQIATLWNFHVLTALERWQRENGRRARDWLRACAEFEALCGLATLAHDEPDWAFPTFDETGAKHVEAEAIGHALIADRARVHNDVALGPPGTFLLVTGSNMSGKSTLLRAIGVNVVLAHAGAPVCARRMTLTPLRVRTSIRVQDSLARGVSYFFAELERLKQVVDAAESARDSGGAVLFLLDEILHGTNTAERRIAATRVIRHLVDVGAIGAVTTHDLELAEDPGIAARARLVHFEETFGAHALSFDYRLRDGLATSTNALRLMEYVGLPRE